MFISRLKLTNFRNIKQADLEFSPEKNLITGPNGSGKTNILEALHYVGTARSFRTHFDDHLMNSESDFFRIEAEGHIEPHDITVEIGVEPGNRKVIKVNSAPVKKIGQLFEYFRLVEFSPYDISIINGPPSGRRRFLSMTISQSDPYHIAILTDYHKTLAQRNALLKSFEGRTRLSPDQEASLSVWDEKLADAGVAIHKIRQAFVEKISGLAQKYYKIISDSSESLLIEYDPSPRIEDYTIEGMCRKWRERRERELSMRQTLYGPHRDELKFFVDNLEAKSGASQGQIKTAVLSLKLAQYQYLKEIVGHPPILLLDEIFSDLDETRLKFILDILPDLGQTFVTTSKLSEINNLEFFNFKYKIESGIPTILK